MINTRSAVLLVLAGSSLLEGSVAMLRGTRSKNNTSKKRYFSERNLSTNVVELEHQDDTNNVASKESTQSPTEIHTDAKALPIHDRSDITSVENPTPTLTISPTQLPTIATEPPSKAPSKPSLGRFELKRVGTPGDNAFLHELLSALPNIDAKVHFEINENFPTYDPTQIQLGFELYGTFGSAGQFCSDGSLLEGVTFHWSMDDDLPPEEQYSTRFGRTNYPAYSNGALARVHFVVDEETSFRPSVTDGNLVDICLRIKVEQPDQGEGPVLMSYIESRFQITMKYFAHFGNHIKVKEPLPTADDLGLTNLEYILTNIFHPH